MPSGVILTTLLPLSYAGYTFVYLSHLPQMTKMGLFNINMSPCSVRTGSCHLKSACGPHLPAVSIYIVISYMKRYLHRQKFQVERILESSLLFKGLGVQPPFEDLIKMPVPFPELCTKHINRNLRLVLVPRLKSPSFYS